MDIAKFKDEETVHLIDTPDGTMVFFGEVPEWAKPKSLGTAVISRVDEKTNTIYFSTPLPEGVKAKKNARR